MRAREGTSLAEALGTDERSLLEHVSMAVAATVWLLLVTPAHGGLHDPRTAALAASLVPALVVVRPWRTVGPWVVGTVLAAAAGALLVLTVTATGWAQADSPASQLVGWVALVLVAGYARTARRRTAVAAVVVVGAATETWAAWFAWWGGNDPNGLAVGSFGWHNQLAAWCAAGALVATSLATTSRSRVARVVATGVTACAGSAVVLSTSRSTLLLLVAALAVLLAVQARGRPWAVPTARAGLAVLLVVPCLAVATSTWAFPGHEWRGPPLLSGAPDPAAAGPVAGDRGTASLSSNGGDRIAWTAAALDAWVESPVVGHGFGSFERTSDTRLDPDVVRTPWVHNGPAEALTSGGLAFGGPVVLLAGVVVAAAVRCLLQLVANRDAGERSVLAGAALASGLLVAHSLVDFDWHYSSLTTLLGVVGGLVLSTRGGRSPRWTGVGLCLACLLAAVGTLVERYG